MKQAENRENNMRALSDEQMMQNEQMQGYRDQYGNQAFDQYMQEESRRDEESQYGQEQEDTEEAQLAIEYRQ